MAQPAPAEKEPGLHRAPTGIEGLADMLVGDLPQERPSRRIIGDRSEHDGALYALARELYRDLCATHQDHGTRSAEIRCLHHSGRLRWANLTLSTWPAASSRATAVTSTSRAGHRGRTTLHVWLPV